ncbi:sugar phosphate isomerase/epimerase, partial [Vibrio mimicus]
DFIESAEEKISSLSKSGINYIGLWTKGKNLARLKSIEDCLKLNNVNVVEINFITKLFDHNYDSHELVEEIEQCIHLAKSVNAKFVTAASFCEELDTDLVKGNIQQLALILQEESLDLALEFLPWTAVSSVDKLWQLISDLELENVSILLDSFHFFKGGSTYRQLDEIPIDKIRLVHLNDFSNQVSIEKADLSLIEQTRGFRLFPGEGDFPIEELMAYLKKRGFKGYVNLEVLNSRHKELGSWRLADYAKNNIQNYLEQL